MNRNKSIQAIVEPCLIRVVANPIQKEPGLPEPIDLRQQRIEEFLAARSLAANSRKAYAEDLARFTRWTDSAWGNVTQRQLIQFKQHLTRAENGKRILADSSVRRILQTLKNFLGWMARSGYIEHDPSHEVRLPKLIEPEADNLSDRQVKAIHEAAAKTSLPERNIALLLVLGHGLRASEASNLNVGDFDGERVKIRMAKADSKGTVPLDFDTQMWVGNYLKMRESQGETLSKASPLFISHSNRNQGNRMSYYAIQKVCKGIAAVVGFDFHPHQLRHTFATNLLLKGVNPYHVMTLTRHKTSQTFRRYTKAADERAAEKAFREIL